MTSKHRALILGAQGRLATHFQKKFQDSFEFLGFVSTRAAHLSGKRWIWSEPVLKEKLATWKPDIVFNFASRWGFGVREEQIQESNFLMPSRILDFLSSQRCYWIQIDSYFNYFYDMFGVDKDFYSQTKRDFMHRLDKAASAGGVKPIQIRAPHLVGPSEPRNRIFRVIVEGCVSKKAFEVSSGNQYLPFLHLVDAANQIGTLSQRLMSNLLLPNMIPLQPLAQLRLDEIIEAAESHFNAFGFCRYSAASDQANEFYSPIDFGPIRNWLPTPTHSLNEIFDELAQMVEIGRGQSLS